MLQGSKEWHEFRRNHIGASEAFTIWNESPKAWYSLWEEKMAIKVNTFDSAPMRHGRETEPVARRWFNEYIGDIVWPDVKESPDLSFLSASLDGISPSGEILWEVKCPTSRRMIECATEGAIMPSHIYQMQQQMYVYGASRVYYHIYYNDDDSYVFDCFRDDKWLEEYLPKAEKFWGYVERGEPPFSEWKTQEWQDNETWMLGLLKREEELKAKLKAVDVEKKTCIDSFWDITGGKSGMGKEITFTSCRRKGAVNYKMIPELKGVDLEEHRKDDIVFWKVSRRKNV